MKHEKYLSFIFKRCLLVTFMGLFVMSGCNDEEFLKETPIDFLTPSNAYTTPTGIEQGLIGLYADVRDKWYRNGGQQSYGLFGMGTDIGYDGETPGGQRFLTNYETSVTPEYSVIRYWWLYLYNEIQRANIIITEIENVDENLWSNETQKNNYLTEAKFFKT